MTLLIGGEIVVRYTRTAFVNSDFKYADFIHFSRRKEVRYFAKEMLIHYF
jgi:hypothetical protein